MSIDFDFSQVDRLANDLTKAAATITAEAETKVLEPTGRQVLADTMAASPRLTGELAASWYMKSELGARVITSDVRQAFYQEFGTSRHPPQPSLFPAADRGEDQMTERLADIANPLD